MKLHRLAAAAFMLASAITSTTPGTAKELAISTPLPDLVAKTYHAEFPKGVITQLDVSEENGITVYDIEFKDGSIDKETDIAADGTMLEFTVVIDAKEVPRAAMRTARKAATGGRIGRIERIELSYETKDAKVVKLAASETHYAFEMSKGHQKAEIITTREGAVLEPAEWSAAK